jgi:DNA-binding IclR family transcriptional regulator
MSGTDGISSGVGVLDKTSLLLSVLENESASLSALVAKTGLPRPTAHRLAVALERLNLLTRDNVGRFTLGPRLAGMAVGARQNGLVPAAVPVLVQLRDRTGASARLHRRRGPRRVCMYAAESGAGGKDSIAVGATSSMRSGAVSQVLLAWEEPDELYEGLCGSNFTAETLAGVRRRGWAVSVGDEHAGVVSIAAPVRSRGRVLAAVALSGPVSLLTRSPGRLYASRVVDAAILVGDRLGG